jgi:ABC-2 type transport system ATP-binding protein
MSLVHLHEVAKSFGNVQAVDGVSFSIDRGEVVGFLGPNGAGKTTTMRLITRALEPDSGTIEIDGRSVDEDPAEARRRIGYLPESNPLYQEMLVGEFLAFMARLRGIEPARIADRIEPAVEQTGIGEVYYRPIAHLSKGYRQRVGLAQAILSEPDILILDEPTEGLDPNQRVEIRKLITRLGKDHTVLLSTHVLQEVQAVCDRLLIIHQGKIIADGGVSALLQGGESGVRVVVEIDAQPGSLRKALEELPSVSRVEAEADAGVRPRFVVRGADGADPRPDIFALARDRDWTLWEMRRQEEDLEQFFHDLTESSS